jgi:hypothetical protein
LAGKGLYAMDDKKIEKLMENLLTPLTLRFILPAYVDSARVNNRKIVKIKFAVDTFDPR